MPSKKTSPLHHQVVGNVGLYFVCYQLSLRGWNVMPTARNARGVDLLLYSQDAKRTKSIQVKALSEKSPVPLDSALDRLFGDFFIICRAIRSGSPESFVLKPAEVVRLAHRGEKEGRVSFWLQPKDYDNPKYREAWRRIGRGDIQIDNEAAGARRA